MQYASFDVTKWIIGCRGMTAEEEGFYIRICMAIYDNDGPLSENYTKLRVTLNCKTSDEAECVIRNLVDLEKIYIENGQICQEMCELTLEGALDNSNKLRQAALKREQAKRDLSEKKLTKTKGVDHGSTTALPKPTTKEKEKEKDKDKSEVVGATPDGEAKTKKKVGTRLSEDWVLPATWGGWALDQGWKADQIRFEADKFKDYWCAKSGKDATKLDWLRTWRNWIRTANQKGMQNGKIDGSDIDLWTAKAATARLDPPSD